MKTYLSFIVAGNMPGAPAPKVYRDPMLRFARTYIEHPAGAPHEVILVNSHGGLTPELAAAFEPIAHQTINYDGLGWDIGGHQAAARTLDPDDWIMCFSSTSYFDRPDWLAAFDAAREVHSQYPYQHTDRLYGATGSWEYRPHLRSTGFLCTARCLQGYPDVVSREACQEFEYGPHSLTLCMGREAWLVAPSGTYPTNRLRDLPNGFRRGDQSDIWIRDAQVDLYQYASPEYQAVLGKLAEGA